MVNISVVMSVLFMLFNIIALVWFTEKCFVLSFVFPRGPHSSPPFPNVGT